MKHINYIILLAILSGILLSSCKHEPRKGEDISKTEIDYLKKLGILEEDEKILLFDSQMDFKSSGNFFSNKRIASYWIDSDETQSSVNFAFYQDIDTIKTKDLSHSLTFASYLEIVKNDGGKFKTYVDGDSVVVWDFFDRAISVWKTKRNSITTKPISPDTPYLQQK